MHPHARPTAVGEVLRAVFLAQNLHETPSTGLVHAPFLDFPRALPGQLQGAEGDFCACHFCHSHEDCEKSTAILKHIPRAARRGRSKQLLVSRRLLQQLFANFPFLLCHRTWLGQAERQILPTPFCSCLMYLGDNNCALGIWAWHRAAQEEGLASSLPAELPAETLRGSWERFWHQEPPTAGALPCPAGTQPPSPPYFPVHLAFEGFATREQSS